MMLQMNHQAASGIIQKVWNFAHVLKDDGLAFMDYTEQITYLLFLKMAWEQRVGMEAIPARYTWGALKAISENSKRLERYQQALRKLSELPGLIGLIFAKPQSKINDPEKLGLLIRMIDTENWSKLDIDVKGEIYEGLLARNADDVRGGAGQYFTPRPVTTAIVEVMQPNPNMRICDPACGTGGFLLAAFDYLNKRITNESQAIYLRTRALHGIDLVPNVARLCAMNLFLRGIGTDNDHPVVSIGDSLEREPERVEMVLTNPPFGKKSSVTIIGATGKEQAHKISYKRSDFWATTSNKQLNFLQHVHSMLTERGKAAVVVPDNVLFEGGAGEEIRRQLLKRASVHTLLRLPTGIWYSPGVKANVLFFDKKKESGKIATDYTWVYDLRTSKKFSLRENPITSDDLVDFVRSFCPGEFRRRKESDRFRQFSYREIIAREKASLDIQWAQAEDDVNESQSPDQIINELLKDLNRAMKGFAAAISVARK
jgi:type I restriction enzyme M protein